MGAIEGKSVRVQTMSDGTLRVTVDIPPYKANEAFNMFGAPGIDVALVRLELDQYQDITDTSVTQELPPTKTVSHQESRLAAMFCKNPKFWQFIGDDAIEEKLCQSEEDAVNYIYRVCKVSSRSEIDTNLEAKEAFHKIRRKFVQWQDFMG